MKWTELTVSTSREGIEPLTAALLELGITGFVVEDPEELEAFIETNANQWDIIDEQLTESIRSKVPNIKIYISNTDDGSTLTQRVREAVKRLQTYDGDKKYGSLEISLCEMRDEDWENNWKAYFKPFTVGEKLAVCPTWERYDNPEGRIVLMIDPASSFGSGLHETTRLCMRALEKYAVSGSKVLDIGCGSGILSVAAAVARSSSASRGLMKRALITRTPIPSSARRRAATRAG
jgi:ribosomal protein L11 methyltransferase